MRYDQSVLDDETVCGGTPDEVLFDVGEPVAIVPCPELPPEIPSAIEQDRTQIMKFEPPLAGATISECGKYRYVLWRKFKSAGPRHCWICLNPSIANAEIDDPSLNRMCHFSKREGAAEVFVVNLMAYRATDPLEVRKASKSGVNIFGPENPLHVGAAFKNSDLCILGWGNGGSWKKSGKNMVEFLNAINKSGTPIRCLGVTKHGHPKHPLYISNNQPLVDFSYVTETDF